MFILLNIYLGYFGINGHINFTKVYNEHRQHREIHQINEQKIAVYQQTIDAMTGKINDEDKIDEFIKQNYEYSKPNEKVIIITG